MLVRSLLLLLSLCSVTLRADAPPGTQLEAPQEMLKDVLPAVCAPGTTTYEASFIKMLLILLLLVVLLFFTIWMLRRLSQGKFRLSGRKPSIHILEKKQLSPKSILYIVEVEGKKVLLSESQLEVRSLTTLEDLPTNLSH